MFGRTNTDITPKTGRLNLEGAAAIVSTIKYRPGWTFRIEEEAYTRRPCLVFDGPSVDAYNVQQHVTLNQRKPLPPLDAITPAALIAFVYHAIQQLELHEVGEFLTVNGERPYDPHQKTPESWTLCRTCGSRTDAGSEQPTTGECHG